MSACPTCGRPPRQSSPVDQVVRGEARDDAPILAATWHELRLILTALPDHTLRRADVIRTAQINRPGINHKTCEHLLAAAKRAGLVRVTYRYTGTPRRRRAYIRWTGGAS